MVLLFWDTQYFRWEAYNRYLLHGYFSDNAMNRVVKVKPTTKRFTFRERKKSFYNNYY